MKNNIKIATRSLYGDRPLFDFAKQSIRDLSESANYYLTFGGLLERQPQSKTIIPQPKYNPNARRETSIYEIPTKLNPEQKAEQAYNKILATTSFQELALSKKVESQQISETDYLKAIDKINSDNSKKFRDIEVKYQGDVLASDAPLSFARGVVYGGVAVVAPPIGLTLFAIDSLSTLSKIDQVVEQFANNPAQFGLNVGAGFAGSIVGGVGGLTGGKKVYGYYRTAGKEFISPEILIEKEVLKGERPFPEYKNYDVDARVNEFVKRTIELPNEYSNAKGIYHASPSQFAKETKALAGSSEYKGLYGAPSLSPHFLKMLDAFDYNLFGLNLKSPFSKPTALKVYVKDILPLVNEGTMRQGFAYVTNIKPELEAVVPQGTKLRRIENRFYSRFKGERFPLQQYEALTAEQISKLSSIEARELKDYFSLLSSLEKPSKPSLIQPSYFRTSKTSSLSNKGYNIFSSLISSKPSNVSLTSPTKLNSYISNIDKQVSKLISQPPASPPSRIFPTYRLPPYNPPARRPPTIPNYFPEVDINPKIEGEKEKRKARRQIPLFSAFIKQRGRFRPVSINVSKQAAFNIAQEKTLKSLSRTFRVKETGATFADIPQFAKFPEERLFRSYKIRKGKREALPFGMFIQRKGIVTPEEKLALKLARRKRF